MLVGMLLVALGAVEAPQGPSLTVYSNPRAYGASGYAIVREARRIEVSEGRGIARVGDLPEGIVPQTVLVRIPDDRNVRILEQTFRYDLMDLNRLFERLVGRHVQLPLGDDGYVEGTLLRVDNEQLVVRTTRGIEFVRRADVKRMPFPVEDGDFVARPELRWLVEAQTAGEVPVELIYETSGFSWAVTYTVHLAPDGTTMDLAANVTLANRTERRIDNARLTLVAGEIHRAPGVRQDRYEGALRRGYAEALQEEQFSPAAFGDYHTYVLERPIALEARSEKQIELFRPIRGAQCKKVYVVESPFGYWNVGSVPQYGQPQMQRAKVFLEAANTEEARLGRVFPAGRVRVVSTHEGAGGPILLGEDFLDHLPRGETMRIQIGEATEVVAERTLVEHEQRSRWQRVRWRIRVANRSDAAREVIVRERLGTQNWTITQENRPHEQESAGVVRWTLSLEPGREEAIEYTAEFTW
jgi:hypothetical protein